MFITDLSQSCTSFHAVQNGFLIPVAEVQIHYFVCKSGEFIAEANLVDSLHSCGVREAVILLLLLIIQGIVMRICDEAVHIIVAP